MENGSTGTSQSLLSRFWPWLAVILVVLLVGFIRFRLLDVALERDEGEYAYIGQLILQGIPPYQLAYNLKLPGTYFAYALGMAIFGQTIPGIHLTLMVANSLTIIFVFLLARKLFGTAAGLAACATFGILSASPSVLGFAVHANHFVILFAVPATLLLWNAEQSGRLSTLFWSGFLYGVAFVMKQQGVCFCLFAVAILTWNGIQSRTILSSGFVRKIFVLGLAMLLPFVVTCLYIFWAGVFSKFWFWTFTYAHYYTEEMKWSWGAAKLWHYTERTWGAYFLFLIWVIISLPFIARNRVRRKQIIFAVAFMCFSFFGTSISLNFRDHYFLLSLPALAVMAGLALVSFEDAAGRGFWKLLPAAFFLLVFSCELYEQRGYFFEYPSEAFCRLVYAEDTPFADMPLLSDYIRENSSTNATVGVVGSEPEIYFYSHRHSATGYIYAYGLMEIQPYAVQMQKEMIHEIETNKPEYLVFAHVPASWAVRPTSDREIWTWFGQYSDAYYDRVAILVKISWHKTAFLQGDVAKKARIVGVDYIAVFKRKPSAH
jgi:hypothetical protein